MRKRYNVVVLAVLVAALIVPFGFALSLESEVADASPSSSAVIAASTVVAPLSAQRAVSYLPAVPDGLKLFLVGAGLFVLAAAVRKAA